MAEVGGEFPSLRRAPGLSHLLVALLCLIYLNFSRVTCSSLCELKVAQPSAAELELTCECGNSSDESTRHISSFKVTFQAGRYLTIPVAELNKSGCSNYFANNVKMTFPECQCCKKGSRKFTIVLSELDDFDVGKYTCKIRFPQRADETEQSVSAQYQAPKTTTTTQQVMATSIFGDDSTERPHAEFKSNLTGALEMQAGTDTGDSETKVGSTIVIIVIAVAAIVVVLVVAIVVFGYTGCKKLVRGHIYGHPGNDYDDQLSDVVSAVPVTCLDHTESKTLNRADRKRGTDRNRVRGEDRPDPGGEHHENMLLLEKACLLSHTRASSGEAEDTLKKEYCDNNALLLMPNSGSGFCTGCRKREWTHLSCYGNPNNQEDDGASAVVVLHQNPAALSTERDSDPNRVTYVENSANAAAHRCYQVACSAQAHLCPPGTSAGSLCAHHDACARRQAAGDSRQVVAASPCRFYADAGQSRNRGVTGCRSRSHEETDGDRLFPPVTRQTGSGSRCPDISHVLDLPLPPASTQARDPSPGKRRPVEGTSVTPGRFSNMEAVSSLDSCSSCCDSETEKPIRDNTFEAREGDLHSSTCCRSGCRRHHHCGPHDRRSRMTMSSASGSDQPDAVSIDGEVGCSGLEARNSQSNSAPAEADERPPEVMKTQPGKVQLNCLSADHLASSVSHVTKLNLPVPRFRSRSSSPRRPCKREDQRRRGDRGRSSENPGGDSSVPRASEGEGTQLSALSRHGKAAGQTDNACGNTSISDNSAATSTSLTVQGLDVDDSCSGQANEVQLREIKTDNETQCKRPVSAKGDNLGLPVRCASDVSAHGTHAAPSDVRVQGSSGVVVSLIQRTESGRSDPRVISARRGGQNLSSGRGHKPRFRQLNVTIHPGSDSQETADSSSLDRSQPSESSVTSHHNTMAKKPLSSEC